MVGYVKNKKAKTKMDQIRRMIVLFTLPVIFLVSWELAVRGGILKANLTPPPSKLWSTFCSLLLSGKLQRGLSVSFLRVFIGFAIGSVAGVVLGFLMGLFRWFNDALSVFVSVFRPIPTIALIPIFIIIFGIGELSNVAVIFVGSFWPVLLNTISGTMEVDGRLLELAYVYRVSGSKTIFKIIFPSAVTSILTGIRLGLGTAWMSVVAAEMIGASSGIGYMIMLARELAQPSYMYVEVFVIGIIGLLLDRILSVIQKKANKKYKGIAG